VVWLTLEEPYPASATALTQRLKLSPGGTRNTESPSMKKQLLHTGLVLGLIGLAASLVTSPPAAASALQRRTAVDALHRAELEEALIRSERTALLYGELIASGVVSAQRGEQ